MTTTMTPEQQLSLAFNEVKSTETALKKSEQAEQAAQARASDSTGLVVAARRGLKNAQARDRVLTAAQAEFNELNQKKDRLDKELADITQAETVRDATLAAVAPLDAAVSAVTQVIAQTDGVIHQTQQAKSQVDNAVQPASPGTSRATRGNQLVKIAQALDGYHTQLGKLREDLALSLQSLQGSESTVQGAAAAATDYATSLQPDKTHVETKLAEVNARLAAEPPADTITQAGAELDAAQRAFDDAPAAERHAQELLKVAREAREEAEKRKREALERRDEAERLFIKGIDISGPNSAGAFIATAVLAEPIPSGYDLQWSSSAGSVNPNNGPVVSFDTGGLPPGSYDIEVSLVQTP